MCGIVGFTNYDGNMRNEEAGRVLSNMNNTLGKRAKETIKFKKILEEQLKLPVYLEDERLTTKSAESLLIKGDTSRKKRKKVIDKVAATIILQSFLDRRRK